MAVCISEAVTNAVVHGYRGRAAAGERIEVRAWEQDGGLCVVVRDYGGGPVPRDDSPGMGSACR